MIEGDRPPEILSQIEQQEYLGIIKKIQNKSLEFLLIENANVALVVDPKDSSHFMIIFDTKPVEGVNKKKPPSNLMILRNTHPVDNEDNRFYKTETYIFDGDLVRKLVEIDPLPIRPDRPLFVVPALVGQAYKEELKELLSALEVCERGIVVPN